MRLAIWILAAMLAAVPALADQLSAVNAVKGMPKVLDAVPDNAGNLWVSVVPDPKIQWNDYAGIVCKVVAPHRARIFLVKMVDNSSVHGKRPQDWRLIGGANCGL